MFPYQDEEGNWHTPPDDAVAIRVATGFHYVDAMFTESDLAWTDAMFSERILAPMLSLLDHSASSKVDGQ
jgi:hypothetical protein